MHILVLGANSDIALAIARKFAREDKSNLYLGSRNVQLLQKKARDIEIRYQIQAKALYFDALDYDSHAQFYLSLNPRPDGVILAFGYLGEQEKGQKDFLEARRIIETNYLGAVSILEHVAGDLERRKEGFIIALGSVAGERGRQSNYLYGSAKGALAVYLSGLRNRLFKHGVRVLTVLPGFVRTKMTSAIELPSILLAEPEEIAEDVYQAYRKQKDLVYTKWFWRWMMLLIKLLPEPVFKRVHL